eukprot:996295-Amphidinium_carterae.1
MQSVSELATKKETVFNHHLCLGNALTLRHRARRASMQNILPACANALRQQGPSAMHPNQPQVQTTKATATKDWS